MSFILDVANVAFNCWPTLNTGVKWIIFLPIRMDIFLQLEIVEFSKFLCEVTLSYTISVWTFLKLLSRLPIVVELNDARITHQRIWPRGLWYCTIPCAINKSIIFSSIHVGSASWLLRVDKWLSLFSQAEAPWVRSPPRFSTTNRAIWHFVN